MERERENNILIELGINFLSRIEQNDVFIYEFIIAKMLKNFSFFPEMSEFRPKMFKITLV